MRCCLFRAGAAAETWNHFWKKAEVEDLRDKRGDWGIIDTPHTDAYSRFGLDIEAKRLWELVGSCKQLLTLCVRPPRFGHRIHMKDGILEDLFCDAFREQAQICETLRRSVAGIAWQDTAKPTDCWWEDEKDFQCGDPDCACDRLIDPEAMQLQAAILRWLMAEHHS
ncbi:unnamed protein product [Polarella glacialis]|uniref:Uncharacterized protein n=1 Tax=Polarella glacialis TaxID=89957 RepID=A0A813H0D0_POLGL|nr:unnamed protein product [Polarella glacialis]